MLGHLDRHDLTVRTDQALGRDRRLNHDLAPRNFLDRATNLELDTKWGGAQIVDLQGGGDKPEGRIVVEVATGTLCRRRGRSPGAVAIDDRSDQTAVDIAWNRDVVRLGCEVGDGLVTVPGGFDLVAILVEAATAVAVGQRIRIMILKDIVFHGAILQLSGLAAAAIW